MAALAKSAQLCSPERMSRLSSILAAILLSAFTVRAEEWISDQFRCALNLPPDETWSRGNATPLRAVSGDLIFSAELPETKQRVAVTATTKVLSNNLQSPAIIARVMECMQKEFGLNIGNYAPVEINGQTFLQVAGRRNEGGGATSFALARAALRENTLYIALTIGIGEEDRSNDKQFTRVLDTFRFIEAPEARPPQANPYFRFYQLGLKACLSAAGAIAIAFIIVMAATRHRHHA
jgi:hypothetical protein